MKTSLENSRTAVTLQEAMRLLFFDDPGYASQRKTLKEKLRATRTENFLLRIAHAIRTSATGVRETVGPPAGGAGASLCAIPREQQFDDRVICLIRISLGSTSTQEKTRSDMISQEIDELHNKIAFLEDVLECLPVGVIVLDQEGKVLMMNYWQERTSRVRRERVLGSYFHETWERLFKQGIMSDYWKMLDNGKPYSFLVHEVYPQFYDQKISAIGRGAPLAHGNGFVLVHDVMEEIQHDKRELVELANQLAESRNFWANLVDSSPNIVLTTDESGIIKSANKTGERMLGYSKSDFVGKHISFLLREPRELDRYVSLAQDGRGAEVWIKKKDGTMFPTRMRGSYIKGENNETQAQLFLLTDISFEKTMEEKLAMSEKFAIYSELMAGIAHQLNNPLVGVANFSALLLERMAPDDANRGLVETINEASRKCQKMLSSMTKSLREPRSTFHSVDLKGILENALDIAWKEEYAISRKVTMRKEIDDGIPRVRGDSLQLIEAFRNIIVNALQAMPNGGELRVTTRVHPDIKEVCIQFADTGVGISGDHLERIFDAFFSTKEKSGGGLGLSFAYRVIESHSGRIDVKSNPGKGTAFTVILPFVYEGVTS